MAKNKRRTTSVRAARTADTAKLAELPSHGWGLTNLSQRASRRLYLIGIFLVLVSTATYAGLTVFAATDPVGFTLMSNTMHTYSGRYGSQRASDVAATAGPSVTIFLIGWLLITLADIARRRRRPITARTLVTLSSSYLLVWLAIVPLQFVTGVLPGDPTFDGVRNLIIAPAIIFALGTVAPVVWLVVRCGRSRRAIQ